MSRDASDAINPFTHHSDALPSVQPPGAAEPELGGDAERGARAGAPRRVLRGQRLIRTHEYIPGLGQTVERSAYDFGSASVDLFLCSFAPGGDLEDLP